MNNISNNNTNNEDNLKKKKKKLLMHFVLETWKWKKVWGLYKCIIYSNFL